MEMYKKTQFAMFFLFYLFSSLSNGSLMKVKKMFDLNMFVYSIIYSQICFNLVHVSHRIYIIYYVNNVVIFLSKIITKYKEIQFSSWIWTAEEV